ncbi:MAG: SDR family NAD(P)-dependent oxidoreductase [Paludibacteraceae bacterium]
MAKYVLITGGTKGIGYSVAKILANSGYNLVLTYASDEVAAIKSRDILRGKTAVEILKADIADKKSIQSICDFFIKNSIRLTSVIFNAGITNRDDFEKISIEAWERVFFANVHFPVFLLQSFIDKNLIEKGGNILFTGSLMGNFPHSVSLAYGVSKSSVHSLVKNLVKFMKPYDIRVNAVAPGFVDTEWQKEKPVAIRQSIESKIALERFCLPEEIAEVYKMIIENGYFNGEIVTLSGGYSYK